MRVVIADDSVLLREGITRILAEGDIEVIAGVGDALSLLDAMETGKPDLAIVDVRMPPGFRDEGLRAALEIRRRWPDVALVVLSQYVEERYATDLLTAENRSVGYLLKDRIADVWEFIDALHRVADGGTVLDPEVVRQLLARSRKIDPLSRLTAREREVLALMAEGQSNAAIARELVVTTKAVEKHVANLFAKLDLPPTTASTAAASSPWSATSTPDRRSLAEATAARWGEPPPLRDRQDACRGIPSAPNAPRRRSVSTEGAHCLTA